MDGNRGLGVISNRCAVAQAGERGRRGFSRWRLDDQSGTHRISGFRTSGGIASPRHLNRLQPNPAGTGEHRTLVVGPIACRGMIGTDSRRKEGVSRPCA